MSAPNSAGPQAPAWPDSLDYLDYLDNLGLPAAASGVRTRSCRRRDEGARQAAPGALPFDQLSTSDYSSNVSTAGSLTRRSLDKSQAPSPSNDPARRELERCWETDSEGTFEETGWEDEADAARFRTDFEDLKCLVLSAGETRLLLPQQNLRSLPASSFSLSQPHPTPEPPTSPRVHHVGPIVQTCPPALTGQHLFPADWPAYLFLPVSVEPRDPAWLACLYSDCLRPPRWQPLPRDSYRYSDGYILLKTCCLHTLFTVVYEEPVPQVSKRVRSRVGGSLVHGHGHARVRVRFPRASCPEDTDAVLRVLYDRVPGCAAAEPRLACPIVMLGPHGFRVAAERKGVEVELPVPDYRDIIERFPRAELVVYESSTQEGEPLAWRLMDLDKTSVHSHRNGHVSVSFSVYHFSFFKVIWSRLTDMLNMGMASTNYFAQFISFPMSCKAYMEENPGDNTFGMEVICFNAEGSPDQTQRSTYRYCVGSNLKPKMVKPGRIVIRLKSQKFEAHVEAGEDSEMEKEEPDFRGRDFEKQFSCIFKRDVKTDIDRGTFGKVVLDRVGENKERLENLFEFNLNKTGIETEASPPEINDRWSIVAVKELAGNLDLLEETNMKKFAQFIGFTPHEIQTRLQGSPDPFRDLLTIYQQRGGRPDEFVQALYAVGRDCHLGSSGCGSNRSGGSPLSTSSGVSGSGSQQSSQHSLEGGLAQIHRRLSYLNPWRNKDDGSDSGTADHRMLESSPQGPGAAVAVPGRSSSPAGSARKRTRPKEHRGGPGGKRRRVGAGAASFKGSYKLEDSYSSSDESGQEDGRARAALEVKSISTEKHVGNNLKLSDHDLWNISAQMNAIKWRALGRTLGLEEDVLLNLEHAHKGAGVRECAYQMLLEWKGVKPRQTTFGSLYGALVQEKMNMVAKHMVTLLTSKQLKGQP